MKIKHLGSGIVLFKEAILINQDLLKDIILGIEKNALPQGYSKSDNIDEEVSEGGYKFNELEKALAPKRYVDYLYKEMPENHKAFCQEMEESFYSCMIEYARIFPTVLEAVKWRTRGYVIKYEDGQNIGPHSDNGLPYASDDAVLPISEYAINNTLTAGLFLNKDYTGGELYFRIWDIKIDADPGDIVIYPSSFLGCHEVLPVTAGIRYAYLSWFGHGLNQSLPESSEDLSINAMTKWMRKLKEDTLRANNNSLWPNKVSIGDFGTE